MKIRTQLVLASFLLSVLPLSGIVVYSYYSSRRALESAYQREATRVAQQMDRRLTGIRKDIEQRVAALSGLQAATDERGPDVRNVLLTMSDAASLIDSVEIKPMPVARPPVPKPPVTAVAAAAPAPKPAAKANAKPAMVIASAETSVDEEITTDVQEPELIDLPPAPAVKRFAMTEDQKQMIRRISSLGSQLGQHYNTLSVEQRRQIDEEIKLTQRLLDESFRDSRKRWEEESRIAQAEVQERRRERRAERLARETEKSTGVAEAPQAPASPSTSENEEAAAAEEAEAPVVVKRKITEEERDELKAKARKVALLFGHGFDAPIRKQGEVVGHVSPQISTEEVIDRVLGAASDDRNEIAFAIDREGNTYARSAAEKQKLSDLGISERIKNHQSVRDIPNWIVVAATDPQSGVRVGVARPVGENFDELRNTAAKNFGYGIALVFVALIGVVPLANHMTRDVHLVMRGAERVAQGDLMTRLPVKSNNEFGQLAAAFNRMAEDLSLHQQTIVQQEVQQQVLAKENERKGVELEDARRFQLSLLPKELPRLPGLDIGVFTRTATEVGGDYYDFHVDGALSVTIGDATGHGAKAGTMVTVIKTLFAAYSAKTAPACFLRDAAEKVKRMDLGRMAMALLVARFDKQRLTVASAGMPPVYVHRAASGEIEELARGATPLGTLGADYADISMDLTGGDTIFFMTDGFPELLNTAGQQLGYSGAMDELRKAAAAPTADGVISSLSDAVQRWHGDQAPNDDVTFVVVRVA
jgi:serine phosphatase RsbU (regulator of sigma subunit)